MIILGIDPGFGTMGYGVIEKKANGDCVPVDYGVVTTPKDESFPVRLAILEQGLNQLYEKYKPAEISVEELFFTKNVTTGIQVAEARGVILLSAIKYCGRLFEYTPNQIKQALTGYGKADKVQMMHVVQSILRLKSVPRPDDAADALAVALCHAHTSRFGQLYGIK
ncbi:MAG: crossover junction endodeoxyribonuclease RuvC [Clostridiales bacterium]|nr:crossover junction endodeoxyribonuclease RuvC [Clostridiales bacterium]